MITTYTIYKNDHCIHHVKACKFTHWRTFTLYHPFNWSNQEISVPWKILFYWRLLVSRVEIKTQFPERFISVCSQHQVIEVFHYEKVKMRCFIFMILVNDKIEMKYLNLCKTNQHYQHELFKYFNYIFNIIYTFLKHISFLFSHNIFTCSIRQCYIFIYDICLPIYIFILLKINMITLNSLGWRP